MFNGLGILMAARCDVVEAGRCIGVFGRMKVRARE